MRAFLLWIGAFFLGGVALVFAINTINDGYRIEVGPSKSRDITAHGICKKVTNNLTSEIFVPTRTPSEWSWFYSNTPIWVALWSCLPPTPPTAEPVLSGTGANKSSVLQWTSVTGATQYDIKYLMDGSISPFFSDLVSVTQTGYTHTGLTNGNTYRYKVIATNAAGSSTGSNIVLVVPQAWVLAKPNLVWSGWDHQVILTWGLISWATRYELTRWSSLGGDISIIASISWSSSLYTDTAVNNGTDYTYKIKAFNNDAESPFSDIVSVRPFRPADTVVRRLAVGRSWNDRKEDVCILKIDGSIQCNYRTISDRARSITMNDGTLCLLGLDDKIKCYGPNGGVVPFDSSATPNADFELGDTWNSMWLQLWKNGNIYGHSNNEPYGNGYRDSFAFLSDYHSFVSISAWIWYWCGLLQDGWINCAGSNYGGYNMWWIPSTISGATVVTMDAGWTQTCVAFSGGRKVACWWTLFRTPRVNGNEVFDTFKTVRQIAIGGSHLCMLYDDGTVDCRGDNTYGQTDIPLGLRDVVEIRASYVYQNKTCALRNNDTVICWGQGIVQPVPEDQINGQKISMYGSKICYITSSKELKCIGSTPPETVNKTSIAVWNANICALANDGKPNCWGGDFWNGTPMPTTQAFTSLSVDKGWADIFWWILQNRRSKCWGYNMISSYPLPLFQCDTYSNLGQIGLSSQLNLTRGDNDIVQLSLSGVVDWRDNRSVQPSISWQNMIDVSGRTVCMLNFAGDTIRCKWTAFGASVDVSFSPSWRVIKIAMGERHVCGLLLDQTVKCWEYAPVSWVTNLNLDIPDMLPNIVDIAAQGNSTCVLKSDDSIQCWGSITFDSQNPICGDNLKSESEFCDDGTQNGQAGKCNNTCTARMPRCGDGNRDPGEICDDGARNNTWGYCNATCTDYKMPVCGNDIIESYDNKPELVRRGISSQCHDNPFPWCSEFCDEGARNGLKNSSFTLKCDATCGSTPTNESDNAVWTDVGAWWGALTVCGNSRREGSEQCDEGSLNGTPGHCSSTCTNYAPTCGDGIKNAGEFCDEGTALNETPGHCAWSCTRIWREVSCWYPQWDQVWTKLTEFSSGLCGWSNPSSPGISVYPMNFVKNTIYTPIRGISVPTEQYNWKCVSSDSSQNFSTCFNFWSGPVPSEPPVVDPPAEQCRGGLRSVPNGTMLCISVTSR